MRVILFQPRFAEMVKAGTKTQTIRCKARCKVGDKLSLRMWTGKPYRSKQETLKEVVCTGVYIVSVELFGYQVNGGEYDSVSPDEFAQADGFKDFGEMALWFGITHGLPFSGELITWRKD